jgi:hypothetical protein
MALAIINDDDSMLFCNYVPNVADNDATKEGIAKAELFRDNIRWWVVGDTLHLATALN